MSIIEIEGRNALRREANLPLLNVEAELALLKKNEENAKYVAFTAPLRARIEAKVLARMRRGRNNPTWLPQSPMNGGYIFGMTVNKILLKLYQRHNRV